MKTLNTITLLLIWAFRITKISSNAVILQFLLSPKALFSLTAPSGCPASAKISVFFLQKTPKTKQTDSKAPEGPVQSILFFCLFFCFSDILLAGHLHVNMVFISFFLKCKKKLNSVTSVQESPYCVSAYTTDGASLKCC